MKFLQRLFGSVESAAYWRDRSEFLEKKLEGERERHRIRESLLLDEILKLAGLKSIFDASEEKADLDGERAKIRKKMKESSDAEVAKQLAVEKQAYIENAIRRGVSEEEASAYFDEHTDEILGSQI